MFSNIVHFGRGCLCIFLLEESSSKHSHVTDWAGFTTPSSSPPPELGECNPKPQASQPCFRRFCEGNGVSEQAPSLLEPQV